MKKISILGDSISTFKGMIPPSCHTCYPKDDSDVVSADLTWWALLCSRMKLELVVNQSYSGARISPCGLEAHSIDSCFSSYERWGFLGEADLIILFGGTNDYGSAIDPASPAFFRSSYRTLLHNLGARYPKAKVFCCTPIKRLDRPFNKANANGLDYLGLCSIVREEARASGCSLIDLATMDYDEDDHVLCDGLHPTAKGLAMIESMMENAISKEII